MTSHQERGLRSWSGIDSGRQNRTKTSLQEQAETKWKWRIIALTLPTLDAPEVVSLDRRKATLRWMSAFTVPEGDSTEFGYNMTWFKVRAL